MYFVDKILAQGERQRKLSVPKKFWGDFPIGSYVKIELLNDPTLFFVDKVQAQGKLQRRIPVPQKFWDEFSVGSTVKIGVMRSDSRGLSSSLDSGKTYFVDKIQAQGEQQRKLSVQKKFWGDFPIGSYVKIELLNDPTLFFVDKVQAQGKLQRRIPVPQKFWDEFSVGSTVKIELMRKKLG